MRQQQTGFYWQSFIVTEFIISHSSGEGWRSLRLRCDRDLNDLTVFHLLKDLL